MLLADSPFCSSLQETYSVHDQHGVVLGAISGRQCYIPTLLRCHFLSVHELEQQ